MTVREAAQQYIDRGWSVTRLHQQSKKCIDDNWLTKNYKAEDFKPDDNIGIKSKDGVVDIDCDCAEAVALAEAFLPHTKAIYGRQSRPRSHWIFRCAAITEPLAFKDLVTKKNIVEVRVNHQSMAPPSTHPDGERVEWDGDDITEMHVDKPLLIRSAQLMATGSMMARYYPPPGARHDHALALAGFLCRLTVTQHEAERLFTAAGTLANDDDIKDRLDAVRNTYRMPEDAPTTGSKRLEELIGDTGKDFVKSLHKFWGDDDGGQKRIEGLNARFFVIDVGTDTVVGEEIARTDERGSRHWTEFTFRTFEDFKRKLIKAPPIEVGSKMNGTPIYQPLADAWLKSPRGTQYERLVYAPEGSGIQVGPRDLNGWKGFTVKPAPGSWKLTREFIWHIVCQQDPLQYEWNLDWKAALFQRPGLHAETGIVCTGKQGTGKNVYADTVIGRCLDARHSRVTTHARQVLGEFNGILSGLCLLVMDEVGLTTEADASALKGLVTGHTIDVNRKGIDVSRENSMIHVMVLSNDEAPLKVANDDRRFAFCAFSDAHRNDTAYFAAIERELDAGGRAAMLHDLLARQVNWDRLRLAPNNDAKQKAKRESWTPPQWFLYQEMRRILSTGEPWATQHNTGERRIKKTELVGSYSVYLDTTKSRREIKDLQSELHKALKEMIPATERNGNFNRAVTERGVVSREWWTLPMFDVFRALFEAAVGGSVAELDEEARQVDGVLSHE